MAQYESWILDFPSRVHGLYTALNCVPGSYPDRRVTRLIMALYPSMLVPLERLDLMAHANAQPHASGDAHEFHELVEQYEHLKRKRLSDWLVADVQRPNIVLEAVVAELPPEPWTKLAELEGCVKDCTVEDLLKTLRHALAHGNLWTMSLNGTITDFIVGNYFKRKGKDEPLRCSLIQMELSGWERVFRHWHEFLRDYEQPAIHAVAIQPVIAVEDAA